MTAILDLTARAISFITAIQTTLLNGAIASVNEPKQSSIPTIHPEDFEAKLRNFIHQKEDITSGEYKKTEEDSFKIRAVELVRVLSHLP